MACHTGACAGMIALLGATASLAAPPAPSSPGSAGGWLNVQELGASGSESETTASTTAGSKEITVADVGDFRVGQGVMVSRAFTRYTGATLWGPDRGRPSPLSGDVMEVRGYDGSSGSWCVYLLEVNPAAPASFRWTDDIGRTWHGPVPITHEWQPLSGGIEVRLNRREWGGPCCISFSGRDQLVSTIEKIEGNVLTLKDAANRSALDAVVRHCDDAALQAAVDEAIREKRNVYFPPGRYRLASGIVVKDATGITLQGSSGVETVLDVQDGVGRASEQSTGVAAACFTLLGGTEVTLRNFRMVGHSGFANRDQCGSVRVTPRVWGFFLKGCNAVTIRGTERVLVENCHATRMASECFYSGGPARWKGNEPKQYTKAITYLRCSVVDSGRNAFNNNDMAENTSVLYCRIQDVGGCTWEGASRFVRFIGNYVCNAGPVAMGNIGSRDATLEELGSGQHIVADNVFESGVAYDHCAIRSAQGANQVVVRNNLFVNFGSHAIEMSGMGGERWLPAGRASIVGNIIDMTEIGDKPIARTAIQISASDVMVCDNQIYVRGTPAPLVTAIRITEPAVNLSIHDNLIRNCGIGLVTGRGQASISQVVDPATFLLTGRDVPLVQRQSHRYRGFHLAWLSGKASKTVSVIESFDPESLRFRLREPHEMETGDRFEVFPPSANWSIHHNTITDCLQPVVLDSYGSPTSSFADNTLTRGGATGVKAAVAIRGAFRVTGNHLFGFDEPGSIGLSLFPNAVGQVCRSVYQNNVIEECSLATAESVKGLWKASLVSGNRFEECGSAPDAGGLPR
ncbi:MAG: right-handed parallel beta-helix repeat-containing protein [Armatimonadetes bacterium]|nr:right-handed parallel beta-helix repeat-containing protein [Armatimonadota bacterium]